ncbi:MAG: DUF4013 domain-containing protein [bacterium]
MFCHNCGKALPDGAKFCTGCGAKQEVSSAPTQAMTSPPRIPALDAPPAQPAASQPRTPRPAAGAGPGGSIDGERAFTFVFKDEKWLSKVLAGGFLFLIPLVGWFMIYGYGLRVIKDAAEGRDVPLPEWDLGECLKRGFLTFVYYIGFAIVVYVPLAVVVFVLSRVPVLGILGILIYYAASLGIGLYVMAALSVVGAEENYGAFFQFSRVLGMIKRHPGQLLLAFVFSIGASIVSMVGLVGLIVCVIFTMFIGFMIMSNILGQYYRIASAG